MAASRLRIRLGRVLGIDIGIHASWFPVFAALTTVATLEFGRFYPGLSPGVRVGMAAVTGVLFFGSLVVHELAHGVVARRLGIEVRGITLFMFGGVAEIGGETRRAGHEFAVAVVGPLASVALAGVFAGASAASTAAGLAAAEGVATVLAVSNLVVAAFNLVPGLPLDGGRLLRAAVWRASGSRERGTRAGAVGGAVVSAALTVLGVVLVVSGAWVGAWYALVGWFLGRLALASVRPPRVRLALGNGEGEAPQPRS